MNKSRPTGRPTVNSWKPTKAQLLAAKGKRVSDLIAPQLKVLFVGINPGLYSGAVGHHFARPGNRFWPVLHKAGFTERQFSPFEERELLKHGYGITNIVGKATAIASELSREDLAKGGRVLKAKIRRYRPRIVAVLGLEAFRVAFGQPKARFGPQEEHIGLSRLWVLPNPSGLNASYQIPALSRLFRKVKKAVMTKIKRDPSRNRANPAQEKSARRTRQSGRTRLPTRRGAGRLPPN